MKRIKKSLFLLITLIFCLFLTACPSNVDPQYEISVSTFLNDMREYLDESFDNQTGSQTRAVADLFNEKVYPLKGITVLAFGESELQLLLSSYESDVMVNAAISSFEVPPESDIYSDCAFVIRPNANLRAPMMHGDGLKYMAGMGGKLSMDFYSVNPAIDNDTIDDFFGAETVNLKTALALVQDWVPVGEPSTYTKHLDPYKTKYRLEIKDPGRDNATAIQRYTAAAYEAFTIYVDSYFRSLNSLTAEDNETLIQINTTGTNTFIQNQVDYDFVYKMGGWILGDDLDTYFLDAFWREDVFISGLLE